MRAATMFAVAMFSVLGCLAPITPMERLQQSANDVANALRFDRTDLAAEFCAPTAREDFLSRHAVWTDKTRVVDLELAGIYLRTQDEAEAIISVSWLDTNGADLHTTEISQRWKHENGTFRLVNEVFRRGDKALFAMVPKPEDAKRAAAAKFDADADATKSEAPAAPNDKPAVPHATSETRVISND